MNRIRLVADDGTEYAIPSSTIFARVPGYELHIELEGVDIATRLRKALEKSDTRHDPYIDMLALAMSLRGNADGSAEGTLDGETIVLAWDYIAMRLVGWRPRQTPSDEALRVFLGLVLTESKWLVDQLRPPTSRPSIEIELGLFKIKIGG